MRPVTQLRHVSARVGSQVLLDQINLDIVAGERVAIVGPNGAGKSSLLRMIGAQLPPEEGRAFVLDRPLHARLTGEQRRQFHAQVGIVFQGLHLVQRLSALDNVLLGCLARCRSWRTWLRIFPPQEVERARCALIAVGMAAHAGTRADRLSGGERQKVAIARVLQQAPRLLLADEPTAALDPAAAREIANMLSDLAHRQGIALVSVLHDPDLLPYLAERVIGMQGGRIVFDLPVARVDKARLEALYQRRAIASETVGVMAPTGTTD